MPVVTRKYRSVLDYESEKALLNAIQDLGVTDGYSSDASSVDSTTACCISTGITSQLSNEDDWVLPDAEQKQLSVVQEVQRLQTLKNYSILESSKDDNFEQLTAKASEHYNVPWACVSLVDMGRQWFLSMTADDLGLKETCRRDAFCAHTILQDDVLEVRDAAADARFCGNPFVTGNPGWRYYAGVPLVSPTGDKIGSFCIMDRKPRPDGLNEAEKAHLRSLATETMQVLEQRLENQTARKRTVSSDDEQEVCSDSSASSENESERSSKTRRMGGKTTTVTALKDNIIAGPPAPPSTKKVLPDPKTHHVDPDEYLVLLVQALHGVTLKVKKGSDLQDYFHTITEEQMAAYNMQVVSVTRDGSLKDVKAFFDTNGRSSLDCFNRFGEGLLNMTCRRGFKEVVQFLLSDDVALDVRVHDDYGRSPMHDACWNPEPQLDICTWLAQKDPSLFLVADKRGFTPFQYARQSDWPVWREFLHQNTRLLEGLLRPEILSQFSDGITNKSLSA